MNTPSDTAITILKRQLRLLEEVLAQKLDREPPEGVPFEDFAREVLGQSNGGTLA